MDISSALYIFCDGKKKIDKYGPQDGHPNIVGYEILTFLRERLQNKEIEAFADIVRGCQFLPYDEMKPDQRTDKSSDILGLLWRKGSMKLYDSEEFADVTDYDYQIDVATARLGLNYTINRFMTGFIYGEYLRSWNSDSGRQYSYGDYDRWRVTTGVRLTY